QGDREDRRGAGVSAAQRPGDRAVGDRAGEERSQAGVDDAGGGDAEGPDRRRPRADGQRVGEAGAAMRRGQGGRWAGGGVGGVPARTGDVAHDRRARRRAHDGGAAAVAAARADGRVGGISGGAVGGDVAGGGGDGE